ncbi:hypothetical protein [Flavobacterium sp. CGRL2]
MQLDTIKNTGYNKILFHCVIWIFFILTSLIQFYESPFKINNDFYVQWITGIVLFYLNYFYLVPIYLLQKKYWFYFIVAFGLIAAFMIIRINYFIPEFRHLRPENVMPARMIPEGPHFFPKGRMTHRIEMRQPLFF